MRKELQNKLYKKYPKIFAQHKLPITQTAMSFGFECGDGWYNIIDMLCQLLQSDIDNNNHEQIEAVQVKEKYGTLRFYVNHCNTKQEGMIDFAEYLSAFICEECASNKNVKQTKNWIYTRCSDCMKKIKKT
jgi:hypothetical protein